MTAAQHISSFRFDQAAVQSVEVGVHAGLYTPGINIVLAAPTGHGP
jgi:hypothetical protein